MRVSIQHHQKTEGFFSKRTLHEVAVDIEFSAQEREAIKALGIGDTVLIERTPNTHLGRKFSQDQFNRMRDHWWLRVKHLVDKHPEVFAFDNAQLAQKYEKLLTEQLRTLKATLDDGMEQPTSKTFEL